MAQSKPQDPGGGRNDQGTSGQGQFSYADRLKTNIKFDQRLKRNVLEITLEKTAKETEIVIDQECVARLCKSIGLNVDSQVEGSQVQFNSGKYMISVWVVKGINLERFCREENINVGKGLVTGMIRPAGRRDVTLTVSGLDFNTPDNLICDYIRKFGGNILNANVIYSKFTEGPFKGKFNGDRKYQVDFTNCTRTMGTYHFLDGVRVRIFYRGNEKTCGRCHKVARDCLGAGIARDCDAQGGIRVQLSDHMRKIWSEIGFCPTSFELPDSVEDEGDKPISETNSFQRPAQVIKNSEADQERYVGLKINNFPLELSDEEILTFLSDQVTKDINKESVDIVRNKKNSSVTISNGLNPDSVKDALSKIDFTASRNLLLRLPLYCRPIRDITPVKPLAPTAGTPSIGTKPKTPVSRIPGLPPKAQRQALERQKKKESEKKKSTGKKEKEKKDSSINDAKEINAFDILMKKKNPEDNTDDDIADLNESPRSLILPKHCLPDPMKSQLGQTMTTNRHHTQSSLLTSPINFDASPDLKQAKRTAAELSSPNSPTTIEAKKNKTILPSQ